jgi:hypothetical protein
MKIGLYGADEDGYTAIPDDGYDFATESTVALHPDYIVAPGRRIVGDYYVGSAEFSECYALESWSDQGDEVATTAVIMPPAGEERALADDEYEVHVGENGDAEFCPKVGQDFGYVFKVKRESEVHTSVTDTESKPQAKKASKK